MTTSDDSTTNPPLKRCTLCGEYFPPTLEFFFKNNQVKSGLQARCKKCFTLKRQPKELAWKKENPDRIREATRRYRSKHPEELVRNAERSRRWRKENPEKARESAHKSRRKNAEKIRERIRNWMVANPHKKAVQIQRRRTLKRALPSTFTHEQWQRCLEWWNHTCAYCGAQQSFWHVLEQEHFVPLTLGGGYTPDNIIPACKNCNSKKRNTPPQEWLAKHFGKSKAKSIATRIRVYFDWIKN